MEKNFTKKNKQKYCCEKCNFVTFKKTDYDRHLLTLKHNSYKMETNMEIKKTPKEYICKKCNKQYMTNSGLWKHEKICNFSHDKSITTGENKEDMKDLVLKLIDENKELRKTITEMVPKIGNNNNNIKQKFNINLFLNEKCKDALSMDQFIQGIEISMKNLLTTRDKGQVEGITDIIIDNMNKLSLYERPMHCTDKKRETIYIKNDEWEKDIDKKHISKAIKQVEHKQIQNIQLWLDQHPNYMNIPSQQDEFIKLVQETSKSVDESREKILKNLCNNSYILQSSNDTD